jgi:hypothetical protein
MWTVLSCVLFAILGAGIAAYLSRGRHPAPIIVGMIVGAVFGLAPVAVTRQVLAARAEEPGWLARIGLLIEALREGEPVIWALTLVLLLIVLVILAVWAKTARDFRREEEEQNRRRTGALDRGKRRGKDGMR